MAKTGYKNLVKEAVYTAYSGNATLSGAVTDMYFEKAPHSTTMPYITYSIGFDTDNTFSTKVETFDLQFNIFDDSSSSETCDNVSSYVMDVYDHDSWSVTGYSWTMLLERRGSQTIEVEDEWQSTIMYEGRIQKS